MFMPETDICSNLLRLLSANSFYAHHFASLHDHLSSGLGELLSTIRKALKRALKQGNSSTTIPIIVRQASQVAN